jgi:hypothetical protein
MLPLPEESDIRTQMLPLPEESDIRTRMLPLPEESDIRTQMLPLPEESDIRTQMLPLPVALLLNHSKKVPKVKLSIPLILIHRSLTVTNTFVFRIFK